MILMGRVQSFMEDCLYRYGPTAQGMGWMSQKTQEERFKILAEVGIRTNSSVLDVGCGVGHLYGYFLREGRVVSYTGYDIFPEAIDIAAKKYPEAHFYNRDVINQGFFPNQKFDHVVCSGMFNLQFDCGNQVSIVKQTVQAMMKVAIHDVAVNFLGDCYNSGRSYVTAGFCRYAVSDLEPFFRTLTPDVMFIDHQSANNDFTAYLTHVEPNY